jgi:RHS repeat-associated protein
MGGERLCGLGDVSWGAAGARLQLPGRSEQPALGSVDTISDSAGNFHQQQFDPFGASLNPSSPPLTRVGFTGQDHDDDLGLIDMKGRLYDPLTARFMSQDPVMQAPFWTQGLNRYSYAFNDPVNNTDPSGFATDPVSGLVIFGDDHLYDFKPVSFGNDAATTGTTTASEGTTAGSAGLSSAAVGVGLSALGNVLDTVLTGGPLDGSRSAGVAQSVATPSAHPQGTGSGTNSTQAKNQNKGGVGPARPSLFDPTRGALAQSVPGAEGGPGTDARSDGTGGSARAAPASAIPLSAPVVDEALAALGRALRAVATIGVEGLIELTAPFTMESDAAPYQASANQMQQEVRRGTAPAQVDRVDSAHPPEDAQDHAHVGKVRARRDGTTNPTNAKLPKEVIKWLRGHGWSY